MTDTDSTAAKRRVDVAFLQCFDAAVFAEPAMMTDADEERLHAPLGSPGAYIQDAITWLGLRHRHFVAKHARTLESCKRHGQKQPGCSKQERAADSLIDQNTNDTPCEEREHGLDVEPEFRPVRCGIHIGFTPACNIEQHAESDADIRGHARHMRRSDASIRDACHHGILQAHEETEPQYHHRSARCLGEPQVSATEQGHQNRLGKDAEGVDAVYFPAPPGIYQQR